MRGTQQRARGPGQCYRPKRLRCLLSSHCRSRARRFKAWTACLRSVSLIKSACQVCLIAAVGESDQSRSARQRSSGLVSRPSVPDRHMAASKSLLLGSG